jgi:nucleotidyltransferase substrate binding protein (TIGR01987 family)
MIDYVSFRISLKRLQLQYANHLGVGKRQALTDIDREAIAESVIRRFKTCYDCLWKVLKRHLAEAQGLPEVPNSPKPVLRLANENGLLPSPVEHWLEYADARIATSHDYSGDKAGESLTLMDRFVPDAVQLYAKISGKSWE